MPILFTELKNVDSASLFRFITVKPNNLRLVILYILELICCSFALQV